MSAAIPREPACPLDGGTNAPTGYRGRAFVYVLAASGPEDLAKVGITHDPLERWSSFHPRWFEAFDLDHSLLIETETRADAQALETRLHRQLEAHNCPMPLTMRLQVGGFTEWYRGAYAQLRRFAAGCRKEGYIVHDVATDWLRAPMRVQQANLWALLEKTHMDHCAGWLSDAQHKAVRDLLDAHRIFDEDLIDRLDQTVLRSLGLLP